MCGLVAINFYMFDDFQNTCNWCSKIACQSFIIIIIIIIIIIMKSVKQGIVFLNTRNFDKSLTLWQYFGTSYGANMISIFCSSPRWLVLQI